jgi:hypothetical protein
MFGSAARTFGCGWTGWAASGAISPPSRRML